MNDMQRGRGRERPTVSETVKDEWAAEQRNAESCPSQEEMLIGRKWQPRETAFCKKWIQTETSNIFRRAENIARETDNIRRKAKIFWVKFHNLFGNLQFFP